MSLRNWTPRPFHRHVVDVQRDINNVINNRLDGEKFVSREKMKTVNWFDRSVWLSDLSLQIGELVLMAGKVYRYEIEKGQHLLSPVD